MNILLWDLDKGNTGYITARELSEIWGPTRRGIFTYNNYEFDWNNYADLEL